MVSPINVGDLPNAFLALEQQEQAKQAAQHWKVDNAYQLAKIAAGAPQADVAETKARTGLIGEQATAGRQSNEANRLALLDSTALAQAQKQVWVEGRPQQPQGLAGVPPIGAPQNTAPLPPPGAVPLGPPGTVPGSTPMPGQSPQGYVPGSTQAPPASAAELRQRASLLDENSPERADLEIRATELEDLAEKPVAQPPPPEVTLQPGQAPAKLTALKALEGKPLIGGLPNFNSDAAVNRTVELMMQKGARPQAIQAYVEGVKESRLKLAERMQKLQNDVDSGQKTQAEATALLRKLREDESFEIDKQLASATSPVERAVVTQRAQVIGFDITNAVDLRQMRVLANKSDAAGKEREAGFKQGEADRAELKTEGLAPGYGMAKGQHFRLDRGERIPVTPFEAMTGSTGPKPPGAVILKGLTSAQRIDAGEKMDVADSVLDRTKRLAELRTKILAKVPFDPDDGKWTTKIGNFFKEGATNNEDVREYVSLTKSLSNDLLRLNKGTQTEGDAVRIAEELPNLSLPPAAHTALLDRITKNAERTQSSNADIQRGYMVPRSGSSTSTGNNSASPGGSVQERARAEAKRRGLL